MKKPRKIIVTVTKRDIALGRELDDLRCPIALALTRRLRHPVTVDNSDVLCARLRVDGVLPKRAQRFIVLFDEGERVRPFKFRLVLTPFE